MGFKSFCMRWLPTHTCTHFTIKIFSNYIHGFSRLLLLLTCCLLLPPLCESVIVLCLYVHSSFAIILMGKRELAALLSLSPWCLVMVVWFFLAVPWVCLRFVIVVLSDHTNLLFFLLDISFDSLPHEQMDTTFWNDIILCAP